MRGAKEKREGHDALILRALPFGKSNASAASRLIIFAACDIPADVHRLSILCHRPRHLAPALLTVGLLLTLTMPAAPARAAAAGVETLINKLPDPAQLSKSPLETAIASQDPMFKDPDFLRLANGIKKHTLNLNTALKSSRVLAEKYPDKPAVHFLHGAFALASKLYPEADAAFHQAVKQEPKFALGWMALASSAAQQNHFGEGADDARRVTQLQPKFAPGWAALGYCESGQKKYEAAIPDYQHAAALARNYAFAYHGMGICYAQANHPADAVAPLKAALALTPRDYLAATELGYCYLRSGQYDDGVKACWQALKVQSGFGKAWDVLGICYLKQGKRREAVNAFQQAVKTAPNDPAPRAHLAEATKGMKPA